MRTAVPFGRESGASWRWSAVSPNAPHPEVLARTSTESTARPFAGRASKDAPNGGLEVRPSRLASRAPQDEDRCAFRRESGASWRWSAVSPNAPHPEVLARTSTESTARPFAGRAWTHQRAGWKCVLRGSLREHLRMRAAVPFGREPGTSWRWSAVSPNAPHPEVLARTSTESIARPFAGRASKDAPKGGLEVRPSRLASRAPQDEDRYAFRARIWNVLEI
ncbi:hypothetical protein MAUB1S_08366 [Mycolicibacterium aubagnense]